MEKELCFRWMALFALLIFYAVYFIKMWTQKKTYGRAKIGRRKEKTLHRVKMLMSVATLGVVAVLAICLGWNHMPKTA